MSIKESSFDRSSIQQLRKTSAKQTEILNSISSRFVDYMAPSIELRIPFVHVIVAICCLTCSKAAPLLDTRELYCKWDVR